MSAYLDSYKVRYGTPVIQQKTEVATVKAAEDIKNEGDAAPDHANRMKWAGYVAKQSSVAWMPFSWPVAMNPSIQSAVGADPSGNSVPDGDVQFVVNSNLDAVIADFIANPPAGA